MIHILQAIAADRADLDLAGVSAPELEHALNAGVGPYLARCCGGLARNTQYPAFSRLKAAELTARAISTQMQDGLEIALQVAGTAGIRPLLLKGIATAQTCFPEPHLRTMGDIDLWMPASQLAVLESELRRAGFRQMSHHPESFFDQHHHSMPFWLPAKKVWIELHDGFFPPWSPHANRAPFTEGTVAAHLRDFSFRDQPAYLLRDEAQLVYTALRWAESLNIERGISALLDATLLLRKTGNTLDWDLTLSLFPHPAGTAALRLLLTFLSDNNLAMIPDGVLRTLASTDRTSNVVTQWYLRRLVTRHLIEQKRFGRLATRNNVGIIWSTLLGPHPTWANVLRIPIHLAFPPGNPRRFHPSFLLGRLRSPFARKTGTR